VGHVVAQLVLALSGLIPGGVSENFPGTCSFCPHSVALGSTQPLSKSAASG